MHILQLPPNYLGKQALTTLTILALRCLCSIVGASSPVA